MGPSLRYLAVRAALFLVPFAALMVADVPWPISLLVALAFAFAASVVFFPKLREEAARDLQRMREGRKREGADPDDADIEDEVLDRPRADEALERPAGDATLDRPAADEELDRPGSDETDAPGDPDASAPRA